MQICGKAVLCLHENAIKTFFVTKIWIINNFIEQNHNCDYWLTDFALLSSSEFCKLVRNVTETLLDSTVHHYLLSCAARPATRTWTSSTRQTWCHSFSFYTHSFCMKSAKKKIQQHICRYFSQGCSDTKRMSVEDKRVMTFPYLWVCLVSYWQSIHASLALCNR